MTAKASSLFDSIGSPATRVGYFSMEIGLEPGMPSYAGGLGVLAGDTLRSAADLGLPFVGVSLLHRAGYFAQRLDTDGRQAEQPAHWPIDAYLRPLDVRTQVSIEGRTVTVTAWRYTIHGACGARNPVLLLDTDLPENEPRDRALTNELYGGDDAHRLSQEIVLGIGGIQILRAAGYDLFDRIHLNEGHAALAVLALLREKAPEPPSDPEKLEELLESVRRACVFTTHTPVPAGHDQFPAGLARALLGDELTRWLGAFGIQDPVNLTELALRASRFVNGVAMRHGEVSRDMFPGYSIRSITNGIHPPTWASRSMASVFDRYIPEWRRDSLSLRYAIGIPKAELWWAHTAAKNELIAQVNRTSASHFHPDTFTLGFARRATAYKRAMLILQDPERLAGIARRAGPIQIVFAGKAHPHDTEGKALIASIVAAAAKLRGQVSVTYLANYDMKLGRLLCAGCDVWLNTPLPPLEASGTSGMKAALNGVPSLSVLDGWWVEGCIEGVTGWSIDTQPEDAGLDPARRDALDAAALYDKLESKVVPCFYGERDQFTEIMRSSISLNASFFNSHRMLLQYIYEAYADRSGLGFR